MYQPFEQFRDVKNRKDLDWYDKNFFLLTEDTWRPLKKNDLLVYVYNEMGRVANRATPSLRENINYWRGRYGQNPDIIVASNFELIDRESNTYKYDISDAKFDSKDRLLIDPPRMRHSGYSFTDDVVGKRGFYLMDNMPRFLQFINYSQIPQTK